MRLTSIATVLAAALGVVALSGPAVADRWDHNGQNQNQGNHEHSNNNSNNGNHNNGNNNNNGGHERHRDSGNWQNNGQKVWKGQGNGNGQARERHWPNGSQNNKNWGNNNPNNHNWNNNWNARRFDDRLGNRERGHDRDRDWDKGRNHDRDHDWDRRRHHHPRWWRPDFYYYGNYWYPQWYNNGWDDSWRYGVGLRFYDDRYWWNYENEWWFWDASGACWREGDPRFDGGYGGDSRYWPRAWNDYHWRFCADDSGDDYDDNDDGY